MASFKEMPYLAQIGIVVTVLTLMAAGGYYYSLAPMVKANDDDTLTLRNKQAEVAQLAPYRARLAELTRQSAALKLQMEEQHKVVPEEKEVPAFITMVAKEAAAAGVEVRRYTPKDTASKEYYVEVPFEVDVDGTYFGVLNFYERMQKLDRIVNVGRLSMGALKNGKSGVRRSYQWAPSETVSASCLLTTFYSNPQGAAAPAKKKK